MDRSEISLSSRLLDDSMFGTGAVVAVAASAHAIALIVLMQFPSLFVIGLIAAAGGAILWRFPEIALAALLTIGSFKGSSLLAGAPDLTAGLLGLLVIYLVVMRRKLHMLPLPGAYWLVAVLAVGVVTSLIYTPQFSLGLYKAAKFLIIDGICIFGTFVLLNTEARLFRFFGTLLASGLLSSLLALPQMGGHARLMIDGGNTIQLGHDSAMAMLGAGSRGPFIGFICCVLFTAFSWRRIGFTSRQLMTDVLLFGSMAIAAIAAVGIPRDSINYLARLEDVQSANSFLGKRAELLETGVALIREHPLRGVGIDGFPSEVVGESSWPHNIVVEIACELGIPMALVYCLLMFLSMKCAWEEVRRADAGLRPLAAMALMFLLIELINVGNTGNMADTRAIWTGVGIPFIVRQLRLGKTEATA